MEIAHRHQLLVIEDAAQAIDSFYKNKALGGIGHLGAFSFHETKNIQCGEGGMLTINEERFIQRAEIIREKGTNRSAFFRGEVDKYGWVDIGSSFLPSEITAAFLFAQLENISRIQEQRKQIWNRYQDALKPLADAGRFRLPVIPEFATNNAHMFYLTVPSLEERTALIQHMKSRDTFPVFHYLSLHKSPFYQAQHDGRVLKNSDAFADQLIRLPLYFDLSQAEQAQVIEAISSFYS